MPPAEAFAYPLLLAAIYGVYRVGRRQGMPRVTPFEWARLAALLLALGVVALLQMRLAASGLLAFPWGILAGILSIAAVSGLLGLHAMDVGKAWRRARTA